MADLINFVSKSDLDAKKAQRRTEREAVLRKVCLCFSHASEFCFFNICALLALFVAYL
jgi:hypothetical protein